MEVSEIIEKVDIVQYISQFADLQKKTDGDYWCLSPLQAERTPSFSVSEEKQRFYDFSSGAYGNVLDFIMAYNKCDFRTGIKTLKDYAGIKDEMVPGEVPVRLAATSIAKKFRPKQNKPPDTSKRQYLPEDYMDRYEPGGEKLDSWREEGISDDALSFFGVRYDSFSDRIVFPIRNVDGRIINVCGRTLDPDFKEKKIRKYTYFKHFGTLDTIYGLAENKSAILQQKEIILFEGAKSVMLAHTWGIQNTGAVLTSHLSQYQMKVLLKLGVRVVFALDAEIDIRKDKHIRQLTYYANVEWVRNRDGLLDEKDSPVDKGKDVFLELYRRREAIR